MALTGKTILITRAASQSAELRSRLEDLGARVIECPTIQIVPQNPGNPSTKLSGGWTPISGCCSQAPTPSSNSWIACERAAGYSDCRRRIRDRGQVEGMGIGAFTGSQGISRRGVARGVPRKPGRNANLVSARRSRPRTPARRIAAAHTRTTTTPYPSPQP